MENRNSLLSGAVIISALGYFVDVYDLILFSVVRLASLTDLGVPQDRMLDVGVDLLNYQMLGMLLGGILWGVLGDKLGRMKALFGSILMYSVANVANGFVHSVETYALCRFIAGIGLAGELGAGITLVTEILPKEKRGYGTTIVATVGVAGAVAAGLTGDLLHWRTSYIIGGVMGLLLLVVRISVHESGMFRSVQEQDVARGSLWMLFGSLERFRRYLYCIFLGLPVWFIVGILVTLAPEITKALGATVIPKTSMCVMWCYVGLFFGDMFGGILSQTLRSRKKALAFYIVLSALLSMWFLFLDAPGLTFLYAAYCALGFSAGFWVLVVTAAAEQFGTNIRATVTTTVPNFIRGAVVPMTASFVMLKGQYDVIPAALIVAGGVWFLSLGSLALLRETFGDDLDYVELS